MTNGDKIRQMSNEELANIINCSPCLRCIKIAGKCYGDFDCIEGIKAYLDMEIQE
jgi:hypothetical protein